MIFTPLGRRFALDNAAKGLNWNAPGFAATLTGKLTGKPAGWRHRTQTRLPAAIRRRVDADGQPGHAVVFAIGGLFGVARIGNGQRRLQGRHPEPAG